MGNTFNTIFNYLYNTYNKKIKIEFDDSDIKRELNTYQYIYNIIGDEFVEITTNELNILIEFSKYNNASANTVYQLSTMKLLYKLYIISLKDKTVCDQLLIKINEALSNNNFNDYKNELKYIRLSCIN